jgi:hypothetical protein
MRKSSIAVAGMAAALTSSTVLSQTAPPAALLLKGEWAFQNTQTKVKYGGPFEVYSISEAAPGRYAVRVSYDGRETNDKCSTRGPLRDTPVEGVLSRSEGGYDLEFKLICPFGQSPRLFQYSLKCDAAGVCMQGTSRPWGEGFVRLVKQ